MLLAFAYAEDTERKIAVLTGKFNLHSFLCHSKTVIYSVYVAEAL